MGFMTRVLVHSKRFSVINLASSSQPKSLPWAISSYSFTSQCSVQRFILMHAKEYKSRHWKRGASQRIASLPRSMPSSVSLPLATTTMPMEGFPNACVLSFQIRNPPLSSQTHEHSVRAFRPRNANGWRASAKPSSPLMHNDQPPPHFMEMGANTPPAIAWLEGTDWS